MKPTIVVCVKQVPESTGVGIDPVTFTLRRDRGIGVMNPFDAHALEEALRIKERFDKGEIIALSMGPPQAEETLRECIGLGADKAVLLSDPAFAGADTLATAYTLSCAIRTLGADIVLCGKQAIDGDTAQVGPGIAEMLGIAHLTSVSKLDIQDGFALAERMVEGGYQRVKVVLPALFTVLKEINEPRLPSLRGKLRAKKAPVTTLGLRELGADPSRVGHSGSPTRVIRLFSPQTRAQGELFVDSPHASAKLLVARLKEVSVL